MHGSTRGDMFFLRVQFQADRIRGLGAPGKRVPCSLWRTLIGLKTNLPLPTWSECVYNIYVRALGPGCKRQTYFDQSALSQRVHVNLVEVTNLGLSCVD